PQHWYLATAGHVLKQIDQALDKGVEPHSFWLSDHGPKFQNPVPFDYINAARTSLDEKGQDYGLILLNQLYVDNLRMNNVVPLTINEVAHEGAFDAYCILGSPSCWNVATEYSTGIKIETSPVMLAADRIDVPKELESKNPRMAFRIASGAMNDSGESLQDIDGLSGGPVFGFKRTDDGRLKYWLVGVQSSWNSKNIALVCPALPLKLILAIDGALE
ncbi:MAG TPA: hypothetical protein VJ835_05830, partial [Fimbriimonadaceae bacterium]|nr:hypothetical protein [Fimbriimonadaceae bacterium]